MKVFRLLACSLLFCVFHFACPKTPAQSTSASVTGLVVDSAGALIQGAAVKAVNDATGVVTSTKTNNEGVYYLPSLEPGTYRIQVEKTGFKTLIKPDITLNLQDSRALNFTLPVGATSETVTVEGGGMTINTIDGTVSTVVDSEMVKNMPLNGRSFQDLILLTPGVVTQTPQNRTQALGITGEFSVNGQRQESNYYTVDGVSANVGAGVGSNAISGAGPSGSVAASTALGTTQALVSVDDLQEFRVQSSTYSAEYGRNPGGQFAFETKSGTNQWHGSAYDYVRNDFFDANDWFNDYFSVKQPPLRQNDFGGTVGGPVMISRLYNGKAKTFFFVSYEGLRLMQPQAAATFSVPDMCMRAMSGSTSCGTLNSQYANTAAGAAIGYPTSGRTSADTGLLPVVDAFPLPSAGGIEDPVDGFGQFLGAWSNPSSIDATSARFDHLVNDKLRVFFRFGDASSISTIRAAAGNPPMTKTTSSYELRTYTAGANSVFSNHFGNEVRFNFTSNDLTGRTAIDSFGGGTPVDLLNLTGLSSGAEPLVGFFYGPGPALFSDIQSGAQKQWNVIDTVSHSHGHHETKFGIDYRRLAPTVVRPTPIAFYLYFDEPSVESNSPFAEIEAQAPAHPLYENFSAFAQDEWKPTSRSSLSLGLRWEVNPAPGVTQGVKPYTVQGSTPATWIFAPQGTALWNTTWYNFAPRLGGAYILRNIPGWETVIRGGGGVFFDTGQQVGSAGYRGPGFSAISFPSISFPGDPGGQIPPIVNPPKTKSQFAYVFPAHLQLPYTLQWNASFEQAMGRSESLSLSYVGSHGSRLLKDTQIATPTNKLASYFILIGNGLTSDYDSLQVQFRRSLTHGLTTLASYTWSHCLDYGSQNYVFGYQRGNCDFDVRDNFSAAFSYDVPNVKSRGIVDAVLRHWGIDDRLTARSGFPVTLNGIASVNQVTGDVFYQGLNLVQGQPLYLFGATCTATYDHTSESGAPLSCPGNRAINPQAFAPVSSGLGNAPRNFVTGLGAFQMDLAVRREFPVFEKLNLQFRGEAFNVFNHPNFGAVNAGYCSTVSSLPNYSPACTFGQATATLSNSLGVLSPLYQMGGPRSMQLALKLLW